MEMHQIRYFLAVARLLNFTRAAEECHVAQPSLTRAIKQLEEELGGDLFRRERNLTHLSELGHRMLPLMQQCYDSAQSAKQIASSIRKGTLAHLNLAAPSTFNIELLLPFLKELVRAFPGLTLRFMRGSARDTVDHLKKGEADLAVGPDLPETWDRLETWPLFSERYRLAVAEAHPFAVRSSIMASELANEKILCRPYCEDFERGAAILARSGVEIGKAHNAGSDSDYLSLLVAGLGIGFAPQSSTTSPRLKLVDVDGFDLERRINSYAVAGRPRSMAASTLIKMLRAADWAQRTAEPRAA